MRGSLNVKLRFCMYYLLLLFNILHLFRQICSGVPYVSQNEQQH